MTTPSSSYGTVVVLVKTIVLRERVAAKGKKASTFWSATLGLPVYESGAPVVECLGLSPDVPVGFSLDWEGFDINAFVKAIVDAGFPGFGKKKTNVKGKPYYSVSDKSDKSLYFTIELSRPVKVKDNTVSVGGIIVDIHGRPKGKPNGLRLRRKP